MKINWLFFDFQMLDTSNQKLRKGSLDIENITFYSLALRSFPLQPSYSKQNFQFHKFDLFIDVPCILIWWNVLTQVNLAYIQLAS